MRSLITQGTTLLLVVLAFTACTDSNQVVKKAPQHESELGQLVLGAQAGEKEKYLSENPATQIRILSEKHGFYEIISETETPERLSQFFPSAQIQKNEFFHKQQQVDPAQKLADAIVAEQYSMAQSILDNTQDRTLQVIGHSIDFQTCKRNGLKPVLKIVPVSDNLKRRDPLKVGEKVVIDASQSQPHAFTGGDLKLSFVVSAPLGSKSEKAYNDKVLSLDLDTMGVYTLMIIAQDVKNICHIETAKLMVTGDEDFSPYAVAQNSNIGSQKFLHKLGLGKAHQFSKGKDILIAVVDSGVNYNHPHLAANIYINPNETDNGQDNDDNGYVGDIHGWDFVNNDPYPFDDNGHGSHVAGLAAGQGFGVAPEAKILPVKVSNPEGMSDLGTTLQGITYALDMGAKVINMSFGSYRPPAAIENRILRLVEKADVLLVAAAGNGDPNTGLGVNTDAIPHMPSGLQSTNLISVAALNEFDKLSYYSNFGSRTVHIATYGGEDYDVDNNRPYDGMLYSAYIPNPEGLLFHPAQGTSMSTPVASGIAALLFSYNPNLKAADVAKIMKEAGPKANFLSGKILSGKILTADAALELVPTPTNLASQP